MVDINPSKYTYSITCSLKDKLPESTSYKTVTENFTYILKYKQVICMEM